MSTDVFETARTHPADAGRTQAILAMLALVADSHEVNHFEVPWQELLATIGGTEPQYFRIAYPEALIRQLAAEARRLFETCGLRAYNPGSKRIADLLNNAWKRFQADPAHFSAWESNELQQLKKDFNLP